MDTKGEYTEAEDRCIKVQIHHISFKMSLLMRECTKLFSHFFSKLIGLKIDDIRNLIKSSPLNKNH